MQSKTNTHLYSLYSKEFEHCGFCGEVCKQSVPKMVETMETGVGFDCEDVSLHDRKGVRHVM
jgi:hypothetical protein